MSGPFKMKGWSPFTAKKKTFSRQEDQPDRVKEAKKLVESNVGNTTVDSPRGRMNTVTDSMFDKSQSEIIKANEILKKEGYSLEDREQMTGAGGYKAAMSWANPQHKSLLQEDE